MIEGGFYPEQPTDSQRKQAYRQSFSGPFARGIPNTGYLLKIYIFQYTTAAHCYLNAALQLLRPTLVWKQSQSYHLAKSLHDFYDNLLDISSLLDILSSELRIRDISRPGDAAVYWHSLFLLRILLVRRCSDFLCIAPARSMHGSQNRVQLVVTMFNMRGKCTSHL